MRLGFVGDKTATTGYALIAALLILLAYPTFVWLVNSWLSNPYYTHGFLVPLIVGLFLWRQWPQFTAPPRQHGSLVGFLPSVAGLAVDVWAMCWRIR